MNSESAKELLILLNSVLVCRHGKRQEIFMTFALAIPSLTVENRLCVLIWAFELNWKNMVIGISIMKINFF